MRLQDVADSIVQAEQALSEGPKSYFTDEAMKALAEAYDRLKQVSLELLDSLDALSEQHKQLQADVESL